MAGDTSEKPPSFLQRHNIASTLEKYFYHHGRFCARHPVKVILGSLTLALLCMVGLLNFQWEANAVKLWIPENSDFARNYAFLWENYAPDMRFHSLLFTTQDGENILEPKYIQKMYETYQKIRHVTIENGMSWEDKCFRLPIVRVDSEMFSEFMGIGRRRRRQADVDDEEYDFWGASDSGGSDGGDDFFDDTKIAEDDFEVGEFDPSVEGYPDPYCKIVQRMETSCFMFSVLELWAKDGNFTHDAEEEIYSLTLDKVIEKVNSNNVSGIFLVDRDFQSTLGGDKRYDEAGRLVYADAAMIQLIGKMNGTLALKEGVPLGDAMGELVDSETLAFEDKLIEMLLEESDELGMDGGGNLNLYVNVERSFMDIASGSINKDVTNVVAGFMIVFVYVALMLGKFDKVENRLNLTGWGIMSCGLAIFASYGICSAFGLTFSPMHNFIPFLILGLGIDDMFVIVQAWKNNLAEEKQLRRKGRASLKEQSSFEKALHSNGSNGFSPAQPLSSPEVPNGVKSEPVKSSRSPSRTLSQSKEARDQEIFEDRFGRCLQHSGVSITVTSLTDFLAFVVGATTCLPALQSFCVFCGVGIIFVYFLQCTWFVAWMAIDEKRIAANRSGFCFLIKYDETELAKNEESEEQQGFLERAFSTYGHYLVKLPSKIGVIVVTAIILGVSIWGNVLLKQKFDPMWFLPLDSYLSIWHTNNERYFPSNGEKIFLFVTDLHLPEELGKLDKTIDELQAQSDIITSIDSWYPPFADYYRANFQAMDGVDNVNNLNFTLFSARLTQYLYSPSGARYRMLFRFDGEMECGTPAPLVQCFTMEFTHTLFEGPKAAVPAMNRVKQIIREANFSGGPGRVFPFSKGYAAWETDEIISMELYRNVALAFLCIFLTTLPLLSDLLGCAEVLLSVVLTMVNVSGLMHFWGLTIETVSCTNLIICIGIAVDSAAHVTHEFLSTPGTRDQRVSLSLTRIGPAVLNGGVSTFLAFILCANSNSHVFLTFFKIFFLVITFAMYNGLVVLPVLLSFIGPPHRQIQPVVVKGSLQDKTNGSPELSGVIVNNSTNGEVSKTKVASSQKVEETKGRDEIMI